MATEFTDKDTYQDIFDPHAYCNIYYGSKSGLLVVDGFLDFALKKLCEAFTRRGVKGKTLIDIGHGPTIYQDLSACEVFDEIIGADYTDRNRAYYERSLRNEPGTFDWTDSIQKVCDMEGKGTSDGRMEATSPSEDVMCGNNFDSRKYLETFYTLKPETNEMIEDSVIFLTFLKNVFFSGRVKGETLIEIGCGPCILQTMSACENFEKIYLADYFQGHLQEIEKWLKYDKDAFDWSPFLKFVCTLENGSTVEEKSEKIRNKVSLMKCDVTKSNPLQPNSLPLADCVLTAGCLTCACKSIEEIKAAVKNIVSLIRPGGYLIILDYFGASYFSVGDAKYPVYFLDENSVQEAVTESGCRVEELDISNGHNIPEQIFDCKSIFCLLACKL